MSDEASKCGRCQTQAETIRTLQQQLDELHAERRRDALDGQAEKFECPVCGHDLFGELHMHPPPMEMIEETKPNECNHFCTWHRSLESLPAKLAALQNHCDQQNIQAGQRESELRAEVKRLTVLLDDRVG